MTTRTTLVVNRASIGTTELRTEPLGDLAAGQVRLRVDEVALTANTVTYAQFGDMLAYWSFYPLDDQWGLVPAIGWGTVIESNVEGIDVGGRYSCWYPMATTVDITATPTGDGFRDDGAHRAPHAPTYRSFVSIDHDPMFTGAGDESRLSLVRGLYMTGYLIDGFFSADGYRGAAQAIVMSASSKTALGYAHAARRSGAVGRLIGVTGAANAQFVTDSGLYDEVVTYDDVASIAVAPSVLIDVAGVSSAVAAIHEHLGDALKYSMIVGKSHHDAPPAAITSGPAPEMFFAPSEVERQVAALGGAEFRTRTAVGLAEFVAGSHQWLTVEHVQGPAAFQEAWGRAVRGDVPPSVGVVATM